MKTLRRSLQASVLIVLAAIAHAQPVRVAWLELRDDPRYDEGRMAERAQGQPWGRPWHGAQVAVQELEFPLSTQDIELVLERVTADGEKALVEQAKVLREQGTDVFVLDLPGSAVRAVADALPKDETLLMNVSARDNALRNEACRTNLLHTAPSRAMLADGLAQYLVQQKWAKVLVLKGPTADDAALYEDFLRAGKRYGLKITAVRPFADGQDPRRREKNNPRLLTRGDDFDVIYVADADGEFARTLPYNTLSPRPVVGGAGLVPVSWHWNWRRHGAPQLNNRFERVAERPMTGHDWSAWTAVKALGEALMRAEDTSPSGLRAYLVGDDFVLDGFQGYPLSFRHWNGQLRSAVLLATPDWVAERAPFDGFLHAGNDLDSLGIDRGESRCQAAR